MCHRLRGKGVTARYQRGRVVVGALTPVCVKTLEPGFRPEKTGSAAAKGGISEIHRRQAIPHPLNPLNLLNPLNPSREAAHQPTSSLLFLIHKEDI